MELENVGLQVVEIFKLYGHARTYSQREIIFQKGDSADRICFLEEGRVRASCLNQQGDEITLFYVDENNLIGKESISNSPIRSVTVDAVTNVKLYSMDANILLETIKKNNISMINLMTFFVRKIAKLSDDICCSHFLKNDEKLAYFLYSKCIRDGSVVNYTHEQIASVTGMNRVTVTRLLNSFVEKNLISQHYKEIKVLDKKGLAEVFNSIGYFMD